VSQAALGCCCCRDAGRGAAASQPEPEWETVRGPGSRRREALRSPQNTRRAPAPSGGPRAASTSAPALTGLPSGVAPARAGSNKAGAGAAANGAALPECLPGGLQRSASHARVVVIRCLPFSEPPRRKSCPASRAPGCRPAAQLLTTARRAALPQAVGRWRGCGGAAGAAAGAGRRRALCGLRRAPACAHQPAGLARPGDDGCVAQPNPTHPSHMIMRSFSPSSTRRRTKEGLVVSLWSHGRAASCTCSRV